MGGKFIVGIPPLTLHRQQLYINRSQYCYEIYDWVRIFNRNVRMGMVFQNIEYMNGGVLKISAVRIPVKTSNPPLKENLLS
jgi:hypothetical protein